MVAKATLSETLDNPGQLGRWGCCNANGTFAVDNAAAEDDEEAEAGGTKPPTSPVLSSFRAVIVTELAERS